MMNSVMGFAGLHQLMPEASGCIGNVVSLGNKFIEENMAELDRDLVPYLKDTFGTSVLPRVISGYATLLWFTKEVSNFKIKHLICICTVVRCTYSHFTVTSYCLPRPFDG